MASRGGSGPRSKEHPCPGCGAPTPRRLLACAEDWARLPASLKRDVAVLYRAYRAAPSNGVARSAHLRAVGAAMTWYRTNPRRLFETGQVTIETGAPIARDQRRNTYCSNCGDTRGGPFGHETSECTWRPPAAGDGS